MSSPVKGILYGSPHSFYTAKVRCYLRKQGIAYQEKMPSDPSFVESIVPKIGRAIIPVWLSPDGQIVQDSIDIIDHFEAQGVPLTAYPQGIKQKTAALWFEYFGGFCMLRPAMHYRWSVLEQQRHYLTDANVACSGVAAAEQIMQRMHSYLPGLGVIPDTLEIIEARFLKLLELLEAHFAVHPYLFGGQPSVGDYGLVGPMYAHLARDPVPAFLLRTKAPKVFRWVERMTANDADIPEFPGYPESFLPDDQIPDTLADLLRFIAGDIFPELNNKLAFIDQWVAEHQPQDGQPINAKAHQRHVGVAQTQYHGVAMESAVAPYLIYLLKRIHLALACVDAKEREQTVQWLAEHGLTAGVDSNARYSVARRKHIEVWQMPAHQTA